MTQDKSEKESSLKEYIGWFLTTILGSSFVVYIFSLFIGFRVKTVNLKHFECLGMNYNIIDSRHFDCSLTPTLYFTILTNQGEGRIEYQILLNGQKIDSSSGEISCNSKQNTYERQVTIRLDENKKSNEVAVIYSTSPTTNDWIGTLFDRFDFNKHSGLTENISFKCAEKIEGMTFIQASSIDNSFKSFYIDQRETTYSDWINNSNSCVEYQYPPHHYNFSEGNLGNLPLNFQDHCPISRVSYVEAKCYCEENDDRSLPTEKEWMYVAKGGQYSKVLKYNSYQGCKIYKTKSCMNAEVHEKLNVSNINCNLAEWVQKEGFENEGFIKGNFSQDHTYKDLKKLDTSSITYKNRYIGFRCVKRFK